MAKAAPGAVGGRTLLAATGKLAGMAGHVDINVAPGDEEYLRVLTQTIYLVARWSQRLSFPYSII